jgi:hypothetical protein
VRYLESTHARDQAGGILIAALGLATARGAASYSIGTLSRMGPGYFPLALGVLLTLVGIAIFLTARSATPNAVVAERKPWDWRGPAFILLGILAFIILGKYGGLVPATFALVFISALGDRGNSLKSALLLSSAILVVCLAVFHWGLQLQFPLFTWG